MALSKKNLFYGGYLGMVLVGSIFIITKECESKDSSFGTSQQRLGSSADRHKKITTLLNNWIKKNKIAGIAVGLVDATTTTYYTAANTSFVSGEPITTKSLFEIGSISKGFATLLLMKLVNKNIVSLDDPIEQYMPGIAIPQKNGKKITFRHLATHTSGLPRMAYNCVSNDEEGRTSPFASYTKAKLYHFLQTHRLAYEPGTHYEYSNVGVGLLGEVLSEITNVSFEELVLSRICKPLKMHTTGISLTPAMKRQLTQGYDEQVKVAPWHFKTLQAAGAIRSSVEDMVKYLKAHMGLVKSTLSTSMEQCHTSQFPKTEDGDIALGWMREKNPTSKGTIIEHEGLTGGYCCYIGFNKASTKGVVILTNSTCGQRELGYQLLALD